MGADHQHTKKRWIEPFIMVVVIYERHGGLTRLGSIYQITQKQTCELKAVQMQKIKGLYQIETINGFFDTTPLWDI